MLGDQTVTAIRGAWQADIETHLEADQTPTLHLGIEHQLLHGAPGLMALQALAAARDDITAPVVVAGGASPLWLGALMHGQRGDPPDGSPDMSTLYAGSDAATYMASRTLYGNGHEPLNRDAFLRPPSALPSAMVRWLAPIAAPGVNAPAETVPIYAATRAVLEQADATQSSTTHSPAHHPINWTAHAAILLAIIMVLAAVVLSLQP